MSLYVRLGYETPVNNCSIYMSHTYISLNSKTLTYKNRVIVMTEYIIAYLS